MTHAEILRALQAAFHQEGAPYELPFLLIMAGANPPSDMVTNLGDDTTKAILADALLNLCGSLEAAVAYLRQTVADTARDARLNFEQSH
jgi:hypothetical protein